MKRKTLVLFVFVVTLSWIGVTYFALDAAACKVLVLQSFSENFFWSSDIKKGIDKVLGEQCELHYRYLDIETDPDGITAKAEAAYAFYQELHPDGVIAVDETTQELIVVPYLKDKVKIPVMFCGVFNAESHGYPASNVSGSMQTTFFAESFTFLQQLAPEVKTTSGIVNDNASGRAGAAAFTQVMNSLSIEVIEPILSNDPDELLSRTEQIKSKADSLFVAPSIEGLRPGLIKQVVETFGKPTFTAWYPSIVHGVLCGVIENREELGHLAAEMLLKAMNGTPINELPVARNEYGKRMINVNTLKALRLEPSRRLLSGVELIK